MDLPSSIDSNLVPGGDGQTRVVSGPVVHETFASSRVSLFIDCALEGNLLGDSGSEIAGIAGFVHEKKRRLGPRGYIGTGGRNTVLQVGTGDRFGVEGFDVEDDGNDVQLEPEARAKVRCLANIQL